jgi:large subunit ribosomal protein L29
MKIKISDVRKMTSIQRQKKLSDLQTDLFKMRSSDAMGGTLPDPSKIRESKRGIARVKTVMRELNEL